MKKYIISSTLLTLSFFTFGQNKDIVVNADIKSVTIYNSSAEINYSKEVSLPKGKTTIVFTDLTPFIEENTINVSASNPDIDIITITEKINYIKERTDLNSKISILQDSINRINNELGLMRCKSDALKMEKELLFKSETSGGVVKGISVTEIEKASEFFSKRYYEISTELFKLNSKETLLNTSLSKLKKQIEENSVNTSKSCSEIRVTVINSSQKNIFFSFKFLTSKAGWAPIYDCKYQGVDKPIKFIFRANVFNASGIDWDNIDIKLSTANPTSGFGVPTLNNSNNKNTSTQRKVDNIEFQEIEVSNSIAEYDIKFKFSIPSDSKPYLLYVNSYEINANFYYLVIPSIEPFGFLMTQIPDWNKHNLLPGITNVYNKGSFMGKTFLNTYAENDTLNLFLGKDNNIQAIRKENSSDKDRNIIGNYYVEKSETTITIKNSTSEKMKIQVLDQVPEDSYGDKSKFSIQNIEQAIYNKREGLLTWNFDLLQNETKSIDYKYEIKTPKGEPGNYRPRKKRLRAIQCPTF